MRKTLIAAVALMVAMCGISPATAGDVVLDPNATRLGAGNPATPINVDIGHAAPFVADFNGDGKLDLLVGQFGQGKLRIYLNTGTNTEPTYPAFEWFMADGDLATVPAG